MKNLFLYKLLIFLLMLTTFNACDEDDPISPQEEHLEAIGTVVYDATGALAVSILRGETNDTLFITAGELSDHFDVKFYNEDEQIVDPPDDEDSKLNYEIGNETIVEWWQHPGEEGGYEFHLRGLMTGITTLELFVQHGDHNDYRSGLIPVKVIE